MVKGKGLNAIQSGHSTHRAGPAFATIKIAGQKMTDPSLLTINRRTSTKSPDRRFDDNEQKQQGARRAAADKNRRPPEPPSKITDDDAAGRQIDDDADGRRQHAVSRGHAGNLVRCRPTGRPHQKRATRSITDQTLR